MSAKKIFAENFHPPKNLPTKFPQKNVCRKKIPSQIKVKARSGKGQRKIKARSSKQDQGKVRARAKICEGKVKASSK